MLSIYCIIGLCCLLLRVVSLIHCVAGDYIHHSATLSKAHLSSFFPWGVKYSSAHRANQKEPRLSTPIELTKFNSLLQTMLVSYHFHARQNTTQQQTSQNFQGARGSLGSLPTVKPK